MARTKKEETTTKATQKKKTTVKSKPSTEKKKTADSPKARKSTKPKKADVEKQLVADWIIAGGGFDYKLFNNKSITELRFKTLYRKCFPEILSSNSVKFTVETAGLYLKEILKGKARVGMNLSTLKIMNGNLQVANFGSKEFKTLISFTGNQHASIGNIEKQVINKITGETVVVFFSIKHDSLCSVNYIRVDSNGAHLRKGCNLAEYSATAKLRKLYEIR